ncbi:DUF4249 domain-containing protein [Chitinophaga sp. 212800010-3]|uniref:DUF4249 domain-containing protein n=1 Tax=unclassified Chitinophaga TaxID=2619133 RepID=UPI002DE69CDC|nr:DUF4249 domain-containing protein [Chitinophaga sp. 212800010-3]
MKYIFVVALLLGVFLIACERNEDIKMPYEGDKIVVNSLIQPDSVIYIRVTRSIPSNKFDDAGYADIKEATVSLSADGVPVAPLTAQQINGRYYYVSAQTAALGRKYTIQVAAPGLSPVAGTDTLPAAPQAGNAAGQSNSSRIQFTLKDNPLSKDYYKIRLYKTDTSGNNGSFLNFRLDPAFNNNLVDFFTKGDYSMLIMDDERFDGKRVNFVLQTENLLTGPAKITVEVSALTFSSYQYFNSLQAQKESGRGVVPYPIRVYSNITNGYGIVGGINTKRMTFNIQ